MITREEATQALADLLPDGKAFEAKNIDGSNLNRLLRGLSANLLRIQNNISLLENRYIPNEDNLRNGLFYKDWLRVYGIPDECWPEESKFEITLKYLLAKISKNTTLITRQDYIDFAEYFGADITIEYLSAYTIKIVLFVDDTGGRWPWTWPHAWGAEFNTFDLLKCVFEENMPAYIGLIVVASNPEAIWWDENAEDWLDNITGGQQWTDE